MKSLNEFLRYVLEDLGTWCGTSTTQDCKTVLRRVNAEGLSFLTITLANFGADLQKGLDQGYVDNDLFLGFKRTSGLPTFMSGFLCQVFDSKSGRLLDTPSVTAIWAIRQFTLMWAKMKLECTDARKDAAFDKFVECERSVRESDAQLEPSNMERFNRIGSLLWARLLSRVDQRVYLREEFYPKHGPGGTADHLRGNAKWNQQEWTERLEQEFPHWEFLAPGWSLYDRLSNVRILEPGAERPVKVITVPKTLKTPRVIAEEPTCMQYMQQAILAVLRGEIEADDIASSLIGIADQVPNQHLAREGSENGTLATLDLEEASDRVSNQHVRGLLRNHPHLAAGVDACRSRKADVPGYGVIRLAKFASMGSALCFPMEAMVFATVVFVGIEQELNRPLTRKDVISFLGQVRVYGDDIIVPVEFVHSVNSALRTFGFKVNERKSFWTGKFRESCGRDYYDGVDVSIVRLRSVLPTNRQCVEEIVSTVSTRNQLYEAGMWRTARFLDELLGKLIPYPIVEKESPLLGRLSVLGWASNPVLRYDDDLHHPLVKGVRVKVVIPKSPLDDYGALLKCLLHLGDANPNEEHLERAGRPRTATLKTRWGSPF